MAQAILMASLTPSMDGGKLVEWNVKIGDKVAFGDKIAEGEADKGTTGIEYTGEDPGTILYLRTIDDQVIPLGGLIAVVGNAGEDFSALLAPIAPAQPAVVATPEPAVAQLAAPAQPAATPAPVIAQPIAPAQPAAVATTPDAATTDRLKASPLAKTIAKTNGISHETLSTIKGSGDGGRIIKQDIDNYTANLSQSPPPAAAPIPIAPSHGYTDTPVSQMRQVIAKRLSESKFSAPHFYLTIVVNMDNAMQTRKQINLLPDTKVSFNDMVIKACASALTKHPIVNSSWLGNAIRQNHSINIGVAMSVPDGLFVPVIQNANQKGLAAIASEVKVFAAKAKDKKLQPTDWQGNTFTISNLGMMGIEEFTAIINPPDACILAVGAIVEKPIVKNGSITTANLMKLTLSCDHRVIDGAVGAAFLQTLKIMLEEPVTMLA